MKRFEAFEDYLVGDSFVSGGRTIAESDILLFAGMTGDFYPLHVDEEYARNTPFGGRIAHGTLTMALSIGQVVLTGAYGGSVVAMLGADKVRALAPVKIGDTIKTDVQVLRTKPSKRPDRGAVTFGYTVRNQRDETVMTFEFSMMIRCRETAEPQRVPDAAASGNGRAHVGS